MGSLKFDIAVRRRDFHLDLQHEVSGEILGVYGRSGAGKSTLLRTIAGLERPLRGSVVLGDRVLTDTSTGTFVPPDRRRIGVVFQEGFLFPHLSVRENIRFGTRYVPSDRPQTLEMEAITELLGLHPLLDAFPEEISGGERQRAAIARALMTSPELLLLDEPFNAVDTALRRVILPAVKQIQEELAIPTIVVSHDLPDIQRLTDTVYVVDNGRCVGVGSPIALARSGSAGVAPSAVVNTIPLESPQEIAEGLFACTIRGGRARVRTAEAPASRFSVMLHPEDVSLALTPVRGVTIQNQLPGTVRHVFQRGAAVYCIVDVGVPVLARITAHSRERLDLERGRNVYCLFKAHSLSL